MERSVELRRAVTDPFFLEMDGYASLGGTTGILGTDFCLVLRDTPLSPVSELCSASTML